jgi:hypothetical protein
VRSVVREIFQRERERISGEKRDSGEEKREREWGVGGGGGE